MKISQNTCPLPPIYNPIKAKPAKQVVAVGNILKKDTFTSSGDFVKELGTKIQKITSEEIFTYEVQHSMKQSLAKAFAITKNNHRV